MKDSVARKAAAKGAKVSVWEGLVFELCEC